MHKTWLAWLGRDDVQGILLKTPGQPPDASSTQPKEGKCTAEQSTTVLLSLEMACPQGSFPPQENPQCSKQALSTSRHTAINQGQTDTH